MYKRQDQYTEALRKTKDALVLLEERLDFSAWVEQGFGTGDACIIADGVMEIIDPVSYTHLDVYKRQGLGPKITPGETM